MTLGYAYDPDGQMTSETEGAATTSYGYDTTGQLTSAGAEAYSYDATGNRTMAGYAVGPNNRLTSDGTWAYSYDAEGQRTKRTKGASAETWTYGYDERGQMSWAEQRATDGGTLQTRYDFVYDVWGSRVQTSVWTSAAGTVVTRAGFDDQGEVWADLDGSNALLSRYLRDDEEAPAARLW